MGVKGSCMRHHLNVRFVMMARFVLTFLTKPDFYPKEFFVLCKKIRTNCWPSNGATQMGDLIINVAQIYKTGLDIVAFSRRTKWKTTLQ